MKLAYKAYDRTGQAVTDVIEATDADEATDRLRRQGLFVASLDAAEGATAAHAASGGAGRQHAPRGRLGQLAMFSRQLLVLTTTGTPLVQSLRALERQAKDDRWRRVLTDVRQRVEEGSALAAAMESHPECFDTVFRSLIAAGESGGQLPAMLKRLSGLTQQQVRVRSSVIGTLVYPCVLMGVAAVVLTLMIGFILPRFAGLYETLDAPLPPSTQLLMGVSSFFRFYWWAVLIALIAAGFGLVSWTKTPRGSRARDSFLVHTPQIGHITRSFATARVCRVMGVLLEGHVPMLEAIALTRESAGNVFYSELIAKAEEAVTRGDNMSSAFEASPLISPTVVEAIRSGESTGQVGPLLLSLAESMDEENELVIKSLTSVLEPGILIVLGLLVGLIAISMFLPLFDLTAMTGGGG